MIVTTSASSHGRSPIALGAALVLAVCLALPSTAMAAYAGPLSVPAEFAGRLDLPGANENIERPIALRVDQRHGEILALDGMRNRVLIFDRRGLYRFEFSLADHIGGLVDVAVDGEGLIHVLGSTTFGRSVATFDFDGVFLRQFDVTALSDRLIQAIVADPQDRLLLLDDAGILHVVDRAGQPIARHDVAASTSAAERRDLVLGRMNVSGGKLFVPASSLGIVWVLDAATGVVERSIGTPGNLPGELNFPVAADLIDGEIVAVLDKMRFAVVCHSTDGRFLGEFGGKGFRDGWFYHPTLMVASDADHVVVGQILDSRVQVCRIPGFVRTRLAEMRAHRGDEVGRIEGSEDLARAWTETP